MWVDLFGEKVNIPKHLIVAERELRDPKSAVIDKDGDYQIKGKGLCAYYDNCNPCPLDKAGIVCCDLDKKMARARKNVSYYVSGSITWWKPKNNRTARRQLRNSCDFLDNLLAQGKKK